MKGILLFGHGARNPAWALPFERIRQIILATDAVALVEPGFLELMRPTFAESIDNLVSQGATEIVVVPIFVAGGGHVNKDLPPLAAEAMTRHAGLTIRLAPPVGEAAPVLAAMAEYARTVDVLDGPSL
ncbi:MAG: CbiX/SirB N-terminal domain-containing protein [Rugosibacter sp.]|jgi:sirohydrochlorin cobaltochelatase|nr:CbiX/SirB N-terminal domain-containing protein [Rugosibacter sp.]